MAIINGTKNDDTLAGTAGDDTIKGAAGNDTIDGGFGNDLVIGGLGADIIQLGDGNDRFQWSQPDWSDVIEVEPASTQGWISASPPTRPSASGSGRVAPPVGLDQHRRAHRHVERYRAARDHPLGGADNIFIYDTNGSDLQQVAIDLASTVGGKTADTKTTPSTSLEPCRTTPSPPPSPAARSRSMAWPVVSPSIMSARPT